MSVCWACGEDVYRSLCDVCDAPTWNGFVQDEPVRGPGVYLLVAECGMWKIGVSRNVAARVGQLRREAAKVGEIVAFVACLPGADRRIETWLHEMFRLDRDAHWAKAEALPHPTEWFWPSRGLTELISNRFFVVLG